MRKHEYPAIYFDPRNTAQFGCGAVKTEADLTQTSDQYKQPHCVVTWKSNFKQTRKFNFRLYEHHAQDSRVRRIVKNVAQTLGSSNANSVGVSGNNPLVLMIAL